MLPRAPGRAGRMGGRAGGDVAGTDGLVLLGMGGDMCDGYVVGAGEEEGDADGGRAGPGLGGYGRWSPTSTLWD
jgi:hypothetical protein